MILWHCSKNSYALKTHSIRNRTRSVIQLYIDEDISEEKKFELERLLSEIKAKNGLPPESRLVYRTKRIVS